MTEKYEDQGGRPGGQQGNGGPSGNQNNGGNNDQSPRRQNFLLLVIAVLVTVLMVSFFMRLVTGSTRREITYNEFIRMIENDEIASVQIKADRIEITPKRKDVDSMESLLSYGGMTYFTGKLEDEAGLSKRLLDKDIPVKGEVQDNSGTILYILAAYVLPILLLWILLSRFSRHMSGAFGENGFMGMGVGKSRAKVYVQKETGVTFADVAGADEAKESLVEVVDFLHNPDRYAKIGARLPKGALLVGPPGTGKTLLARAVAGEAHVPFFSLTGSDFIELYVGVGASRVRDLFREAEKNAPCIVFIDEIDAIGRSRDSKYGGNEEREQTLNQLLSEMDGFDPKKGIIILAATNRPEILDKALLRPGRFDRRIIVDKPDLKGREAILNVHAKGIHLDDTADLHAIALATSGAVGSDLANMINESAINAVKDGRNAVSQKDLFNAVEQVLVGKEKKDRVLSEEEKKVVAYHETGHALIAALQKNSEPVQKITIVPRTMGALGYVMQVPEEEKYLDNVEELHNRIVGLLGGQAAEEVVFGTITTGSSNDLEKATAIARAMVTRYGMSRKFGFISLQRTENQYLDGRTVMDCAEETAAEADKEVMKLLKDAYKEARRLLKENRILLDRLAAHLLEQETITGREFMEIYRREKGLPEVAESEEAAIVRRSMEKAGVYGNNNGSGNPAAGNDSGSGSGSSNGGAPAGPATGITPQQAYDNETSFPFIRDNLPRTGQAQPETGGSTDAPQNGEWQQVPTGAPQNGQWQQVPTGVPQNGQWQQVPTGVPQNGQWQ
ncbi:MAG: ATP-dependent zinc metalloprotease FtsH [Lachnospiraceae bacterium]|nr:ATP-dependent zinc metalloprotease FtsH [Lachnospiraceae bacterium]